MNLKQWLGWGERIFKTEHVLIERFGNFLGEVNVGLTVTLSIMDFSS